MKPDKLCRSPGNNGLLLSTKSSFQKPERLRNRSGWSKPRNYYLELISITLDSFSPEIPENKGTLNFYNLQLSY